MRVAPGRTTVQVTTDSNGKLATTAFTVTVKAVSTPGDVNMDGLINVTDVTRLIEVAMGSVLNNYDPAAADLNHDGKINVTDVTLLLILVLNQ